MTNENNIKSSCLWITICLKFNLIFGLRKLSLETQLESTWKLNRGSNKEENNIK